MMNEKNDLMQDISSESSNNLRKYLMIGGGVFVLFVVGIVAAKFLFSEPKKSDTAVILPPEVTTKQKKDDTALFNDIPVENDTDFKKPLVEKTTNTQTKKTEQPKLETKKVEQKIQESPKPIIAEEKIIEKPKVAKKEVKIKKVVPKKVAKTIKKYYIQVAATRGKPSKRFLKLITKNGFTYKIMEVNVKGIKVKRILVGGYATYKDVKKALPKVKSKISSSAFIKVIK